jgi:predicted metal-dependent peptidase
VTARLLAVQTTLDLRVRAGEVEADVAEDLQDKLDDAAGKLHEGEPREAAKRVADVRDKLVDLRNDGKIPAGAYDELRTGLDSLAESLPSGRN